MSSQPNNQRDLIKHCAWRTRFLRQLVLWSRFEENGEGSDCAATKAVYCSPYDHWGLISMPTTAANKSLYLFLRQVHFPQQLLGVQTWDWVRLKARERIFRLVCAEKIYNSCPTHTLLTREYVLIHIIYSLHLWIWGHIYSTYIAHTHEMICESR